MSPALIWFLAGLVLVLAEFATPGVILVFIGLGAWVASLAAWAGWVQSVGAQTAVFAISSVVLLVALRRLFKTWFLGFTETPATAGELEEYVGKTATVITPVGPGLAGKVEFKGAQWRAESTEALPAGAPAVITAVEGLTLRVSPRS